MLGALRCEAVTHNQPHACRQPHQDHGHTCFRLSGAAALPGESMRTRVRTPQCVCGSEVLCLWLAHQQAEVWP